MKFSFITFRLVIFLAVALSFSLDSLAQSTDDVLREARNRNVQSQSQAKAELAKRGISENQARQMARMRGIDYDTFLSTYFSAGTPSTEVAPQVTPVLPDPALPAMLVTEVPEVTEAVPTSNLTAKVNKDYFGYDIFENNPFFQKEYLVGNIDEGYIIAPGDVLRIVIFGNNSLEFEAPVDMNGNINIPNFGVFMAAGNNFATLKERLKVYLGRSFYGLLTRPQSTFLDVSLNQIRPTKITVVGESQTPGPHLVTGMATVLNALYASGGVKSNGSLRNIRVYRNNQLIKEIDLYDFIVGGNLNDDIRLTNNDIIYIPPRMSSVRLGGKVKKEAIYELKPGEGLKELVRFSGGLLPDASLSNVNVRRITPFEERQSDKIYDRFLTAVNYQQLVAENRNFILNDGDEVSIMAILNKGLEEVKISGSVNAPGAFPIGVYKDLQSLILKGTKNIAPNTYLGKVDVYREDLEGNKTFQTYNLQAVLEGKVNVPLQSLDSIRVFSLEEVRGEQTVKVSGFIEQPKTLFWRENLSLFDLIFQSTSLEELQYQSLVLDSRVDVKRFDAKKGLFKTSTFNLNDLELLQKTLLEPKDEVVLYSRSAFEEVNQSIRVVGYVKNAGTVRLTDQMRIEDAILAVGGFAEYADQAVVVVNRESFDPVVGKLSDRYEIELDREYFLGNTSSAMGGFILQNNDIVSVRKMPGAKRLSAITISGAVYYPGAIVTENVDENLNNIIRQAGGLLPNAYLKGSYIRRGDHVMAVKLHRSRNLKQSILEDGDEIFIAEKSGTVETLGAVENEAIFVWREGKRAKYYLKNSGGKLSKVGGKAYVVGGNGFSRRVGLFQNPRVSPNSRLIVNQNPPKEKKEGQFMDGFVRVLSLTTGALTTLLLIQRLDN